MERITGRIRKWDSENLEFSWLWELILFFSLNFLFYNAYLFFFEIESSVETKDVGIVVVGLVAAAVSLLTSYNAKENEINKYRVKWCDEIRNISNEYITEISYFRNVMNFKSSDYESSHGKMLHYIEVYKSKFDIDFLRLIEEKNCKVDLYLMRGFDGKIELEVYDKFIEVHNKVLDLAIRVEVFGEALKEGKVVKNFDIDINNLHQDFSDFKENYIEPLRSKVAKYLDDEWKKVKVGGFNYRVIKIFLLAFISSIIFSFLSYLEVF